jgi:hypothetical protein
LFSSEFLQVRWLYPHLCTFGIAGANG